jgi:hypothetical protein
MNSTREARLFGRCEVAPVDPHALDEREAMAGHPDLKGEDASEVAGDVPATPSSLRERP